MAEWISVKDRLPPPLEVVVLVVPTTKIYRKIWQGIIEENMVDEIEWYADGFNVKRGVVTHWMPLPEAPKGE